MNKPTYDSMDMDINNGKPPGSSDLQEQSAGTIVPDPGRSRHSAESSEGPPMELPTSSIGASTIAAKEGSLKRPKIKTRRGEESQAIAGRSRSPLQKRPAIISGAKKDGRDTSTWCEYTIAQTKGDQNETGRNYA